MPIDVEKSPGAPDFQPDTQQPRPHKRQRQKQQQARGAINQPVQRRGQHQPRAGPAKDEIRRSPPVPVLLQARGHTIKAHRVGHKFGRLIRHDALAPAVPQIEYARPGPQLFVHLEGPVFAQEFRHIAVGVVDIAEGQRLRDAGIDAGRCCLGIRARHQTGLDARIYAIDAKGAFLCHAQAGGIFAHRLVTHLSLAVIGGPRLVHAVARIIGAGHRAIGAADADVVIDGDNPVGALFRGRRGADIKAGRFVAMHAADRHECAAHIGECAGLEIQHLAPHHARGGGILVLAGGGAGLAADATVEIGNNGIAGHFRPPSGVTRTLTISAPEPVASVSSSIMGVSAFIDGARCSFA